MVGTLKRLIALGKKKGHVGHMIKSRKSVKLSIVYTTVSRLALLFVSDCMVLVEPFFGHGICYVLPGLCV